MKILFITQFFYPDIQATSKIFTELCEDLAKDYSVRVICGEPLVEPERRKSKSPQEETYNGIEIKRVPTMRMVRKSIFKRILNHISFSLFAVSKVLFTKNHIDLVIFTSDNPLNFIPAFFLFGKPKMYICQDLYLEQGLSTGFFKKGLLTDLLRLCRKLSYKISNKVVAIGERMTLYLVNNLGVPKEKTTTITNWVDTNKIVPLEKDNPFSRKHDLVDKFVVLHSGRLGVAQDLMLLLKCAKELKEYSDIKFVIIGEGLRLKGLKQFKRENDLSNVKFLPYQPEGNLKEIFASSCVSVILYNTKLAHSMVPSRLYSFMASSRPVIASVDEDCSTAAIIEKAKCGFIIDVGDQAGLKENILKIYNDRNLIQSMGEKGRKYAVKHFSRSYMTQKYKRTIKQLITDHR